MRTDTSRRCRTITGLAAGLACTLGVGCLDAMEDPAALVGATADHDGPRGPAIEFEPTERPVPEVPFPNDLLLTPDATKASGASWNVSIEVPTKHESTLRDMLNDIDGFGLSAPVFIPFEGPLDLSTVDDDTVLLVNIEPGHPREGERVLLDMGKGYFPQVNHRRLHRFWAFDHVYEAFEAQQAVIRDEIRAELIAQGLSEAEVEAAFRAHDISGDNLVFQPDNRADLDGDGRLEDVVHYEFSSHTLILQPVLPMAPECRHAVLVMRGLEGQVPDAAEGTMAPVVSPFAYKAHAAQAADVARALELVGKARDDLAFGWTFTTTNVAKPMTQLRDGLYGEGLFARLGELFPPRLKEIRDTGITHDANGTDFPEDPQDHTYILQAELLASIFGLIGQGLSGYDVRLDHVDYFAFGSVETPDTRTGYRRTMGLDSEDGTGEVGTERVPFVVSVPNPQPGIEPPFPVMFYFHGTGTSRMEILAIADSLARQGIAGVGFDQVGHGPLVPDIELLFQTQDIDDGLWELLKPLLIDLLAPDRAQEFEGLSVKDALKAFMDIGLMQELAAIGRTTDENGDGALESSESFFFANPFRQCSAIWQDLVDLHQMVRVVRSLDPGAVPPAIEDPASATAEELMPNLLAGDFNADGVLDFGGPDVHMALAGTSLGGFHAILGAALEPEITTVSPIVAGGKLSNIMARSSLTFITERIFHEAFGPLVVGCPDGEGGLWLSFNDDTDKCKGSQLATRSFARVADMPEGTQVVLRNVANGEWKATAVSPNRAGQLGFSVAVESDRWDPLEVELVRPDGSVVVVPAHTPYEGSAFERNSQDFRRFLGIAQHVLGRCDPVNFARHLFLEPLEGHPPTSVLYENAIGDTTVPISTGVMVALATGVFGDEQDEWKPVLDAFVARGVMEGAFEDVDDVLRDNPPDKPPLGPFKPVASGDGVSSIRFADVDGWHEWIAGVDQSQAFDPALYAQNQLVLFHRSKGTAIVDDLCIDRRDYGMLDTPEALFEAASMSLDATPDVCVPTGD